MEYEIVIPQCNGQQFVNGCTKRRKWKESLEHPLDNHKKRKHLHAIKDYESEGVITINGNMPESTDINSAADSNQSCKSSVSDNLNSQNRSDDKNTKNYEDNDFTRFAASNQLDGVLPSVIWKCLEKRDYESLMNESNISNDTGNSNCTYSLNHSSSSSSSAHLYSANGNLTKNLGGKDQDNASTSSFLKNESNEMSMAGRYQYQNRNKKASESSVSTVRIPDKCYVALDCEMVGVGEKGRQSALARCSIVNYNGNVIYDKYIRPDMPITDYRTRWSGIRPRHMQHAISEYNALQEIYEILENRIIIGHAVYNDFKVLRYQPQSHMVRDTACCKLLVEMARLEGQGNSLKKLAFSLLGKTIQSSRNGHNSVEDAQTALELFKRVRSKWEVELFEKWRKKGVDVTHTIAQLEHAEAGLRTNVRDEVDYLSDKFWPSDLLTS